MIITNGVYVGMTKPQYEAYEAAKKAASEERNAKMHQRRPRQTPRKPHKRTGLGPIQLRRGYQPPPRNK